MNTWEMILIGAAAFLFGGILVSKVAARFGVPALLMFLVLGMLAGSDGPGGLHFDNPAVVQAIGVVALAFILFSGGLDTRWRDVRVALRPGLALSTLGVCLTALAVGAFAVGVLGFSWAEGILLGSIMASTDAAAVFSVLRGRGIQLRGRLKAILEFESGSNDPIAVFLTVGMLQLVTQPGLSPASLVPLFALQMSIGALVGVGAGAALLSLINRARLEYDGLYPVMTIATVLMTYGLSTVLGGNGFLAVYLAGLWMARHDFVHKRSLLQFHDGLAWLMQIGLFVTLGLQVFPSRLADVAVSGLLVAAFLIFVARPVSVFAALARARLTFREKAFLAWVGLRGGAPIVLATFPLLAGIARADMIFHMVFFIVLTSVLLQGALLVPAARLLQVYSDKPAPRSLMAYVMQDGIISDDLLEVTLPEASQAVGKQLVELGLPDDTLVLLIGRAGDIVTPRGGTVLQAGDQLLLLTNTHTRADVRQCLEYSRPMEAHVVAEGTQPAPAPAALPGDQGAVV